MPAKGWRLLAGLLALAAVAVAVFTLAAPPAIATFVGLPVLAAYSLARMGAAYFLALAFSIPYGYAAATNKRAAVLVLPVLDILQSVPILAFFPAAILFFVSASGGSAVGLELAVVFLIFTSMAWNMAFGVYESLTTLPHDLGEAADSYGLTGALRFRRLVLPAMVPKLVYNSILSWTNGWFFLVASEIFSSGSAAYTRPGLGSFLALTAQLPDAGARSAGLAAGLLMLALVVILLDVFVWRPLSVWSDRFKLEAVVRPERSLISYERLRWLPTFPFIRTAAAAVVRPFREPLSQFSGRIDSIYHRHKAVFRALRTIDVALFAVILALVVATGLTGLVRVLVFAPLPPMANLIPAAAVSSFLRLAAAYGISVAWTLPTAVYIAYHPRVGRFATPSLEILASIPATALVPVVIGFAIAVLSSIDLGTILIAALSMQWYLLFNLLSGARAIPAPLDEAARVFGLRGRLYWRRLILPWLFPSFITGSVTAWGAGWNALIVAEYIPFVNPPPQVLGLGWLLNVATFTGQGELLLLGVLTMVVLVLAMNQLLWRPLYRLASHRYRME